MIDATKQHFFKKFIDDTFGYYRVYDALKIRIQGKFSGEVEINNAQEFWEKVYQGDVKYRHKQIVKLKDFFLSEWVPKLPGRITTPEGQRNLMEGLQDIQGYYSIEDKIVSVLGPIGKMKMMTGGYGSLRLNPTANSDYCTMLNLVHVNDWHCDYGIPIVVSKSVYETFLKYRQHEGAPWIEKLTGILYLDTDIPHIQKISNSIGNSLDNETIDILSNVPNQKKAFIYVSSPNDISMKYNNSHPEATAWTLFKTKLQEEPLRLTYARFNPRKEESLLEAVGFLNQYVATFDGDSILTDFDGVQKRLMAKTNLQNPNSLIRAHSGTLKTIDNWIKQEKKFGA